MTSNSIWVYKANTSLRHWDGVLISKSRLLICNTLLQNFLFYSEELLHLFIIYTCLVHLECDFTFKVTHYRDLYYLCGKHSYWVFKSKSFYWVFYYLCGKHFYWVFKSKCPCTYGTLPELLANRFSLFLPWQKFAVEKSFYIPGNKDETDTWECQGISLISQKIIST